MNPDRIVTSKLIEKVKSELLASGMNETIHKLNAVEPDLWDSIVLGSRRVNQLLALTSVSDGVRSDVYQSTTWTALVAVEALRRGHYRLWRRTQLGTLLEQLDPTLKKKDGNE